MVVTMKMRAVNRLTNSQKAGFSEMVEEAVRELKMGRMISRFLAQATG